MVELRRNPGCGVVALFAGLREPLLCVIWIVGVLKIFKVARNACFAGQVEISIRVTLVALQGGVRAGQRKTNQSVIESRRLPGCRRVALAASLRQAHGNVIRIIGLLEIRQVAACAAGGSPLESPICVASRAVEGGVHSGKREAGEPQVIELYA